MREFLFRGKSEKFGNWIEGSLIIGRDLESGQLEYLIAPLSAYYTEVKKVISETVGQYTGLTDKNGKKIFESDIIRSDNGRVSAISVVQYGGFEPKMFYDLIEGCVRQRPKEKMYGLFLKSSCGEEMLLTECSCLIEIIGNIHDNPELLSGE